MADAVVKLGSSIVAEENGELRLSVVARITEEVAALHRSGVDVVIVTSGAIARGVQMLSLPVRPHAIEELQAASAVGQGRLYRTYDDSMGTWLQVGFLRTLLDDAIGARSPPDELQFRTNLRDHARYALWEFDKNIAHLDASAAKHGGARYLRLIKALRSASVNVRTTIIRLTAEP